MTTKGPKLRKWSAGEDRQLVSCVNDYLSNGTMPDYRMIAKKIAQRSPKQCRERYENSLQPDVKRGEWSLDETICLSNLMTVHGQNWAAVKDLLPSRTYNAIKKKGRKLLGEIVDRNSIPKGTSTKAPSQWTSEEFNKLLQIHLDSAVGFEQRQDFLFLALNLKTGRSEAEIERQLIQHCCCEICSQLKNSVDSFVCDSNVVDVSCFKDKWSLWKATQVLNQLEHNGVCKSATFRSGSRRASTISTSSASTMATCESAPKRRRLDAGCFQIPDDESCSMKLMTPESVESIEQDLFSYDFWSNPNLCTLALPDLDTFKTEPEDHESNNSQFELDLSFLLPL